MTAEEASVEIDLGAMVVDSALLRHGRRVRWWPLRAHRADPIWSASPPASFAIIQRGTVPLQRFWIPVHVAITIFSLLALFLTWPDVPVRRLLYRALTEW